MAEPDPRQPLDADIDVVHHVTPKRIYYTIFTILIVLTGTTITVAFVNLGILNTPIALGIAGIKASLVILYFMHVRYSTRLTWVVVVASFMWLGVLFFLTFTDYLTRFWSPY